MRQWTRTWLSGRALLLHLALVVGAGGCMAAFWWQLHRALGGNTLSWAYTFEWPFFAAFAGVVWWQLLHDDPERAAARRRTAAAAVPDRPPRWDDGGDEDVAAYNRYLEQLAASGRRKSWRG